MRAPAVSFANKLWAAALAALLTFALVPASAFAGEEGDTADAPAEEPQEVSAEQVDKDSGSIPVVSTGEGGTLASVLVGTPTAFINSDVALNSEPVIGSFTVDGLTFAVTEGSDVELVGVSPDWQQVTGSQEGNGSPVAPMLASGPDGSDADGSALALPESVTYDGIDYAVTSIGAYAFYLSGVTDVELPASIAQVDDRAFRSSDVASVTVADGNPSYSSFDGALCDAAQLSLLLIPEGKQGTVLLPSTAESAAPSVFSHCPLVTQISVEEGSAAFASENGLLYDASLTTLLRVPAGATDITIRDGCTAIAAGAMEACASLATITAPASVTSISPDVFISVPTVSLPAATLAEDAPQLTAMVALSSTDDDLPEVDPAAITAFVLEGTEAVLWQALGLALSKEAIANVDHSTSYAAETVTSYLYPNGGIWEPSPGTADGSQFIYNGNWTDFSLVGPTVTYRVISGAFAGAMPKRTVIREGYGLLGWGASADATTYNYSLTYAQAQSRNWWAIWGNLYTILFDTQGGNDDFAPIDAIEGTEYALPLPSRPGYVFLGWDTQADGQGTRYQAGDKVSNLTTEAGATVTLYAQWCLSYDLTLPICDPSEITFKVDATTGDISAVGETADADGVHHDGAISSSMAVPVALSAVSLEALKGADGAYGLSSIFPGDDPLAKARLTLSAGDARASVAFGGSESSVSGFVVPPVQEGGKLAVQYGLELAEGVGPGDIAADTGDAAIAVGRLAYTADVIGGIASEEGFFILDTGQAGRVVGVAEIKRDADALAELAYQGQAALEASKLYQRYRRYLEEPDVNPTYVKVYDQADDGYSLHRMQVLGICQDTLTTPRTDASGATIATKAGLTFGFKDLYAYGTDGSNGTFDCRMNPTDDSSGGWTSSAMRRQLRTTFWNLLATPLQSAIALVSKGQQINGGTSAAYLQITTDETIWLPSMYEMFGTAFSTYNEAEAVTGAVGDAPFQYQAYQGNNGSTTNTKAIKSYEGVAYHWWLRSAYRSGSAKYFCFINSRGDRNGLGEAGASFGIVPCFAL